jgi:hypothetical protein
MPLTAGRWAAVSAATTWAPPAAAVALRRVSVPASRGTVKASSAASAVAKGAWEVRSAAAVSRE